MPAVVGVPESDQVFMIVELAARDEIWSNMPAGIPSAFTAGTISVLDADMRVSVHGVPTTPLGIVLVANDGAVHAEGTTGALKTTGSMMRARAAMSDTVYVPLVANVCVYFCVMGWHVCAGTEITCAALASPQSILYAS